MRRRLAFAISWEWDRRCAQCGRFCSENQTAGYDRAAGQAAFTGSLLNAGASIAKGWRVQSGAPADRAPVEDRYPVRIR